MPEAWLTGPIDGVPASLMPAAHAFAQAVREIDAVTRGLTEDQLWARPGGAASIGFHLRHVTGSLDRLLTYARGLPLNERQLAALAAEDTLDIDRPPMAVLLEEVREASAAATDQLRHTSLDSLGEPRAVGRARLPSTVLGLLFHAAEHTSRHVGQIVTLSIVVRGT